MKFWAIVLIVLGALLVILSCLNLFVLSGAYPLLYVVWIAQGGMQVLIGSMMLSPYQD